ncbi:MAG: hypothetical protein LQ347_003056 [Umbilicaria vellea]|nr:MAG: hypothetical protein LQ347_003056 [Umbilicaria vellea]
MLHELLLALSGHPSPLLLVNDEGGDTAFPLLSPPERALLSSLAHLGDLHIRLRARTSTISASHPSTICRAISTAVVSKHLVKFQQKILEVEKVILRKDAGIVGAYNIVPLSGLVGEFDGWRRVLDWLWDIVQYMLPEDGGKASDQRGASRTSKGPFTGAQIIDKLRDEAQTGYPDLERIVLDLLVVGEGAWLRQVSAWVLYGRLPTFGAEDFFVFEETGAIQAHSPRLLVYGIRRSLLPKIVSLSTANSILFIGKSLNHIRDRVPLTLSSPPKILSSPEMSLLPVHLRHLSSLSSPLTSSNLSHAIRAIRLSLSQNTLQKLLPLSKILSILSVLKDYFLLELGEFAVALISEADARMASRHRGPAVDSRRKGFEGLAGVVVKEGEVSAILARTWNALASLRNLDDEDDDGEHDLARQLIHISTKQAVPENLPSSPSLYGLLEKLRRANVSFDDVLLPTPITLSMHPPSPLDLFLIPSDVELYSYTNAYLLALRRAHLHLTGLWRLPFLRRQHPAPLGPPQSCAQAGQEALLRARERSNKRAKAMRAIWATTASAIFLLAEVGEYLQGEVIRSSWTTFRSWLDPTSRDGLLDTGLSKLSISSSNGGSLHVESPPGPNLHNQLTQRDPESLSNAHRRYLECLVHSLLLDDRLYTRALRLFMTHIDHLIALIERLSVVQHHLDLEIDVGVMDTFTNYKVEEQDLLKDLSEARSGVDRDVAHVVQRLRDVDTERAGAGTHVFEHAVAEDDSFVPWRSGGLDRLLMKLDFASGRPPDVHRNDDE